jgi:hypothetical protein
LINILLPSAKDPTPGSLSGLAPMLYSVQPHEDDIKLPKPAVEDFNSVNIKV